MKKITLLLAISFAFQFNLQAQCPGGAPDPGFVCIDANLELRLIAINVDTDPVPDFQISIADAQSATGTLNISNQLISDFSGIEVFTNITGLNAGYNEIPASLDVSAITGLTSVNIEGCIALESLNTTGLVALTVIEGVNAALTALDVTSNTALQTLNVRNNSIDILDLSNNSDLVVMVARSNGLTDLDMRNGNNVNVTNFDTDSNGDLTCIFVDDASSGYLASWSKDALSTYVNDEAECNTLTVEDVNQNVFNMYPNPVMNTVFVNANTQNAQISIYDITGKVVLTKSLNLGENTIDVSQMASGVYLARFAAEGNVQTKKLIVQ